MHTTSELSLARVWEYAFLIGRVRKALTQW